MFVVRWHHIQTVVSSRRFRSATQSETRFCLCCPPHHARAAPIPLIIRRYEQRVSAFVVLRTHIRTMAGQRTTPPCSAVTRNGIELRPRIGPRVDVCAVVVLGVVLCVLLKKQAARSKFETVKAVRRTCLAFATVLHIDAIFIDIADIL
jgi:hypothetical protein